MPEPTIERRQCFKRVIRGAAAVAYCPALGALTAAPRVLPAALVARRWFKIGACDWSLGKAGTPEALSFAAKIGLDGVQVSFGAPGQGHDLRQADNRRRYQAVAKEHGVEVASLALGVLNSVPYKSDPRTDAWVSDSLDAARALGVGVVLLAFFGKGDLRGDREGTAEVVRRLKRVAPKAEKLGVVLGLETWLSAAEHLAIIEAVGSPAVQVYYDVGNSLHRGYDIYAEIRRLGRTQICELHAKDYAGKLFGQGDVDFWEVRRATDDIGYSGWIQIEGRTPYGIERSYRHDLRFLKGLFPARA